MNQVINLPPNPFGPGVQLPAVLHGVGGGDELGAGVLGGFGIVSFKGKVWRTKYRGEEQVLLAADGRNPRPELEVVVIKAASVISKTFYKERFVDGAMGAPDCFSADGVRPDPAAADKQNDLCVTCKQNAWGSRITENGKAAKACSDNKRLVIVPATDLLNESLGGPMMLRVPPTSLQDMAAFGRKMEALGFPYYSFVTRLRFDPAEAYPKFVFEAIRPLTEDEAKTVLQLRDSDVTQRILEARSADVHHDTDANQVSPPAIAKEAEGLFTPAAAKAVQDVEKVQAAQPAVPVTEPPTPAPTPAPSPAPIPVQAARPVFDPMTGEKIVYPAEQQSFPDIPSGLKREKAAKPVKAEPKAEDVKVGGSFEAQLDSLLGLKK